MALRVDTKELSGVTVVSISGRLTLGDDSELRNRVKGLLAEGKKRLVLDLGDVSYMDSAGLGTLVAAYTSARNSGTDIKLANLSKKSDQLLSITKLLTVFEVHPTVEEAVNSFR